MGKMEPSTKKRKLSSEPSVEMEDHLKDFAMAFDTKPSGGEGGPTSMSDSFSEYLSGAEDELSHLLDIWALNGSFLSNDVFEEEFNDVARAFHVKSSVGDANKSFDCRLGEYL